MRRVFRRRFSSLDSALWDARDFLMSRLALLRDPPALERGAGSTDAAQRWAADELMLRMLQRCMQSQDPRGVERGRSLLTEHLSQNPGSSVTWDRLVAEHWVRVVWGRWHLPYQLQRVPDPKQTDDGTAVVLALDHLRGARTDRQFVVPDAERLVEEHRGAHPGTPQLDALTTGEILLQDEGEVCIVPHSAILRVHGAWLAARLWDRKESGPAGPERLSWWRDRVFDLGIEMFHFGDHLGADAREEFEKLAWDQVLAEDDLVGWERERERFAAQAAARSGLGELERGLAVIRAVPVANPIARLEWVDRAGHANENQEERIEIGALVSTILRWRATFRSRNPWDAWITDFVEASESRPYLLYEFGIAVRFNPATAADLLLVPEAAALGLGMLADSVRNTGRGWNWEVKEAAGREAEQSVWQDVAECTARSLHHLPPEAVAAHVAAVLVRFAALAKPAMGLYSDRGEQLRSRYEVLRETLVRWPRGPDEGLAFDRLGEEVVGYLSSMLAQADPPIEAPAFDVIVWLAAFGADDQSPWRAVAVRAVVDAYRGSLNAPSNWYHDVAPRPTTWSRLARWLVEHDQPSWRALLAPADFSALAREVSLLEEGERYAAWRSFVHQLRTHALLLLTLAASWDEVRRGEAVPAELDEAIVSLLRDWLPAGGERPSMIDADVDIEHSFERRRESLLVAIGNALPRLSGVRRKDVLEVLLSALTEVRQIATLQQALSEGPEKDAIRARLASLSVLQGTADVHRLDEVQRSVDALLDAGEVDRAEVWLDAWASKARHRRIQNWARWEVGARQRIRLARKRFEEAADEPMPEWAVNDFEARRTNDFHRGVAMLQLEPPRAKEAAIVYEDLLRDAPQQPSYAVNLFAARTQSLTKELGDRVPTPEEDDALRDLLAFGESLLSQFAPEQRAHIEDTYQVNRLYLFKQLRDWPALLSAYQSLPPPLQRNPELASYAVRALELSGQASLAAALRVDTGAAGAVTEQPRGTAYADGVAAVRSAILQVPEFGMRDQARAWWGKEPGEALTDALRGACQSLTDIAPALASPENGGTPEEDRVTKLLAELLRQRLLKLGWQVSSQEHGGYTAKDPSEGRGGIGERDLEIRAESEHVAVGEAVLAHRFDSVDLTKHFRKLFCYTPAGTPMAFLLIWSYGNDPCAVWDRYLREVAATQAPAGHEFRSWVAPAEGPSSHVWCAVSEHAHPDSGTCRVAHVLVDLRQAARRNAAAAAHYAAPKRSRTGGRPESAE